MNIGVILAAGDSKRFGGYINKQYLKLNGKEVVSYSLNNMRKSLKLDEILLVVDEKEFHEKYIEQKYQVKCLLGGETRNISIKKALDYIKENYNCDKIIIQDSVRPLTNAQKYDYYLELLDDYDAVVTQNKIIDGLVDNQYNNINRTNYQLIETPEAFNFEKLYLEFFAKSPDVAVVSQLKGAKIKRIKSDIFNMKITYPEDLFICEQLARLNYYSVDHNEKLGNINNCGRILLLGGSGGVGQALVKYFEEKNIEFLAPTHQELDLKTLSVQTIKDYLSGKKVEAIINAAAIYYDDASGLSKTFDDIFQVNVKANLVLIEYAESLQQKLNLVFLSSSSSTKGRTNLTNYSAAKAALNSIVESQAERLSEKEIYLNAIIPEKVNTPLIAKLHKTKIDTRELLEPTDVIEIIMYFCSSQEYGKLIHVRKGM